MVLPTHSLGQNFLIDDRAATEIVSQGLDNLETKATVIEIGPGLGALTEKLSVQAQWVYCIEIDTHLLPPLAETLKDCTNVTVRNEDFLKVNPATLPIDASHPLVIVSNLPYYIMTPIMLKLFREWPEAERMVFTVEKAACERIFALPGSKKYGPLAIFSSLYGSKEILMDLPKQAFHPAPHTTSAIVLLEKSGRLTQVPSVLFPLVQSAFAQRRKQLVNSLGASGLFPDGKAQIEQLLQEAKLPLDIRAENITPEQYLGLAELFIRQF